MGYASYQIKLPGGWKQIEHSSNFQVTETFQDGQNLYKLVIEEQKNYNDQTGKPFTSLKELTGLPYDVVSLVVDGQQALRSLPRAGSEYIYKVLFFSGDAKLIYGITLETPSDGSKIQEGEVLFNQILSTFKFLDNIQKENQYSCPQTGWENCMPILTSETQKQCSKEAINWKKKNCPNFQGVAQ